MPITMAVAVSISNGDAFVSVANNLLTEAGDELLTEAGDTIVKE